MGRLLAVCGWLAWQVGRPFRARSSRARSLVAFIAAALLVVLATLPIVVPQLDPQPADVGVQEIFDAVPAGPGSWVRLQGRAYALAEPVADADADSDYALLVDQAQPLRAIVVRGRELPAGPPEEVTPAAFSGHLAAAVVTVEEALPIEATVAGTPPRIVPDRILELDAVPKPPRAVWWPLSIAPLMLAGVLVIGGRAGYPVFRPATVVDVLAAPLAPGERLPAVYGGRVGPNRRDLADPGGVLLLVRRGPSGNVLTAQPLADDGGVAPAPVTIGGGWTSGRIGEVSTLSETVPALAIRSELVDATFLFARTAERDRVAALITLER